jgi:hypothetical protein
MPPKKTFTTEQKEQKKQIFERRVNSIFADTKLSVDIDINFMYVDSHIQSTLEKYLTSKLCNKCSEYGFIKDNSISITTWSNPELYNDIAKYTVEFDCKVFDVKAGTLLKCKIDSITENVVLSAVSSEYIPTPFKLFISADQQLDPLNGNNIRVNETFQNLKEGDMIIARVINFTAPLEAPHMSIMGTFVSKDNISV